MTPNRGLQRREQRPDGVVDDGLLGAALRAIYPIIRPEVDAPLARAQAEPSLSPRRQDVSAGVKVAPWMIFGSSMTMRVRLNTKQRSE